MTKLHRYNSYYLGYDITIPDSFRAETKSYPVSPDM